MDPLPLLKEETREASADSERLILIRLSTGNRLITKRNSF